MKTQLPETAAPPRENASCHHDENSLELSLSMSLPRYGGQSLPDDATVEAPSAEVKVVTATGPIFSHGAGPCSGSSMTTNMSWLSDAAAGGSAQQPWSLAARREAAAAAAAFEQKPLNMDHGRRPPTPPPAYITSGPQPIPVVGWPPVRATRKNMAGPRPPKTGMDAAAEKEAKKAKTARLAEEEGDGEAKGKEGPKPSTMFVKVNMEGLAVGRKIDLMAHDGYQSLSRAVRTMFDNFLPAGKQTARCSERGELEDADLILLYEDNEGDKMLVGDVPWKMFVGSVKRLYIIYRTKTCFPANGGEQAKEENEQCTTHLAD